MEKSEGGTPDPARPRAGRSRRIVLVLAWSCVVLAAYCLSMGPAVAWVRSPIDRPIPERDYARYDRRLSAFYKVYAPLVALCRRGASGEDWSLSTKILAAYQAIFVPTRDLLGVGFIPGFGDSGGFPEIIQTAAFRVERDWSQKEGVKKEARFLQNGLWDVRRVLDGYGVQFPSPQNIRQGITVRLQGRTNIVEGHAYFLPRTSCVVVESSDSNLSLCEEVFGGSRAAPNPIGPEIGFRMHSAPEEIEFRKDLLQIDIGDSALLAIHDLKPFEGGDSLAVVGSYFLYKSLWTCRLRLGADGAYEFIERGDIWGPESTKGRWFLDGRKVRFEPVEVGSGERVGFCAQIRKADVLIWTNRVVLLPDFMSCREELVRFGPDKSFLLVRED